MQVDCVLKPRNSTYWISLIEVSSDNDAQASAKLVAIPTNSTGYVLAEVRSNLGADKGACGTDLLLYTADTAIQGRNGILKIIDSKYGCGGCDVAHGGELNDAPVKEGGVFDMGRGVVVKVWAKEGNDFVLDIERK